MEVIYAPLTMCKDELPEVSEERPLSGICLGWYEGGQSFDFMRRSKRRGWILVPSGKRPGKVPIAWSPCIYPRQDALSGLSEKAKAA